MKLLSVFIMLISCLWMGISTNILVDKKLGIKRRVICFVLESVAYSSTLIVQYSEIAAIWFFPICLLIVYYGMGKSKLQLLYVPLSYIIVVLCNYIVGIALDKVQFIRFKSDVQFYILAMIMITILVIFLSHIFKKLISVCKKNIHEKISKEIYILIVGNIILCSLVYLVNGWALRKAKFPNELEKIIMVIVVLYMLLTIAITLFTMRIVRSQEKIKQEEEQRKNLLEYTSQVEGMYEELRAFKHDYVNILASLSGYIEKDDMEGLAQYFEQNILPTNEKINQGKYHLQKLSKIQDPAIKGLISSKLIYAMNTGLDVFVDIIDDVTDFSMRTIDLIRIMGIYLDNATDAALETEKKELKLNVVKEQHSVTIVLMNSFVDHGLSVGEMEKQHVSTKGEGRGLGLDNVNEILRTYSNVNKMTEIRGGYFVQTLTIADKEK